MRCPHCKNKVIQRVGDVTRIRAGGPLEFTANGCKTRCHWCKGELELPLSMAIDLKVPTERYLIRTKPTEKG